MDSKKQYIKNGNWQYWKAAGGDPQHPVIIIENTYTGGERLPLVAHCRYYTDFTTDIHQHIRQRFAEPFFFFLIIMK